MKKMPLPKYAFPLLIAVLLLISSVALLSFWDGPTGISSIIGNLASRVFVSQRSAGNCPILLVPGWNLFSFYCTPENNTIEAIFNSTGTNLTIYSYNSTDANDSWKVYRGDLPEWVVLDLHTLSTKSGYWVDTERGFNFSINGTMNMPEFIELYVGWNLVGYPLNITQPVSLAIGDVAPVLLTIHKYEPLSGDPWKVYSTSSSENDLEYIEPNYGYWINTNGSAIWVINS